MTLKVEGGYHALGINMHDPDMLSITVLADQACIVLANIVFRWCDVDHDVNHVNHLFGGDFMKWK